MLLLSRTNSFSPKVGHYFPTSDKMTNAGSVLWGSLGAWTGAKYGAEKASFRGPVGGIIGGLVGAA